MLSDWLGTVYLLGLSLGLGLRCRCRRRRLLLLLLLLGSEELSILMWAIRSSSLPWTARRSIHRRLCKTIVSVLQIRLRHLPHPVLW